MTQYKREGKIIFMLIIKANPWAKICQSTDSQTCAKAEGKDPETLSRKWEGHNASEHFDRTFTIVSELPGGLDIGIEHVENKHVVLSRRGKLMEKSERL